MIAAVAVLVLYGCLLPVVGAAWAVQAMSPRAPRMGDIGDDQKEWRFEPLTAPSVPEPVVIPEPAPEPEGVPA